MFSTFNEWLKKTFADKEAVVLTALLLSIAAIIWIAGSILQPVFIAIVISYLLYWLTDSLRQQGLPYLPAMLLVYVLFLGAFLASILVLLPLVWQQFGLMFDELPNMILKAQDFLYLLPERFPAYFSHADIDSFTKDLAISLRGAGRSILSASIASIPSIIGMLIYVVLVPLMVFFFVKDKERIVQWFMGFLPKERTLLTRVWVDIEGQVGNYVRGKVVEMIIVFVATYLGFLYFHLKYAMLLAFLVGLSVAVPYIGAIIVTIPVIFVAMFQWGLSPESFWLLLVYTVIQAIDGNVLAPVLFSEAVSMHPVAIIISIILFGGFWGIWGVFFAIPLAVLIRAVLYSWPMTKS